MTENPEEKNLAFALSVVKHKAVEVYDEIYDSCDPWVVYASEKWKELKMDLYRDIEKLLMEENEHDADHNMTVKGLHYRIIPFMQRNGFRECSGWWIKNKADKSQEK